MPPVTLPTICVVSIIFIIGIGVTSCRKKENHPSAKDTSSIPKANTSPSLIATSPPRADQGGDAISTEKIQHKYDALQSISGEIDYSNALTAFIKESLEKDPTSTINWLMSLKPSPSDRLAWVTLGIWAMKNDPKSIESLVDQVSTPGFASALLEVAIGNHRGNNPEEAWKLLQHGKLLKESRDNQLVDFLWAVAGKKDVALLKDYFSKIPENSTTFSKRHELLFHQLAKFDADAAIAHAKSMPKADYTATQLGAIINTWPDTKLLESSEFLKSFEPGGVRDKGVGFLVSRLATSSPSEALIWAESISDEKKRFSSIVEVAARTRAFDPKKAMDLINGTSVLSPEQKLRAARSAGLK
jgi:hypothetical protein